MDGYIGLYHLENWWLSDLSADERTTIESVYKPIGVPDGSNLLTQGKLLGVDQSKLSFLSTLATWFKKPETYQLAKKIIDCADRFVSETDNVLDVHYYYQNRIEIFYRNRDTDSGALDLAIQACEAQIFIAKDVAQAFSKESRDGPIRNLENLVQSEKDLVKVAPQLKNIYDPQIKDNEDRISKLKTEPPTGISISLPIHIGYKQLSIIKEKQGEYEEVISICERAKSEGWNGD